MTEDYPTSLPTSSPHITERDIVFECPSCGKSLVVDESAEGAIVDCPRCDIKVIVPPKTRPSIKAPLPLPPTPAPQADDSEPAGVAERGAALGYQLKEIQMQRTEIHNRVASRLNELNRDLVQLARLDATQQNLVAEWNQLVGAPKAPAGSGATPSDIFPGR